MPTRARGLTADHPQPEVGRRVGADHQGSLRRREFLSWRKTDPPTGDVSNPGKIGLGGWQEMRHLFLGGDGIIYAVPA